MMTSNEKILGENRRNLLVQTLKAASEPISGTKLGEMANVSRQVIVGDITLLKAMGEPIMATSRGYIYLSEVVEQNQFEKTIACLHTSEQTEEELFIFVDHGVTVKDVKVEHPIYGDLTASIMVSNRKEAKNFVEHITETNASLLLELTEGFHLHTVTANSLEDIEHAEQELKKAGILIE